MANLFKKAAVFTDVHFGKSNNSVIHNEDCLDFVKWVVEQGQLNDCDTAIICGDWHHNRATTNSLTLNYTIKALDLLNMSFPNVYFITGNHDLFYRHRRDISSVAFAKYFPNIHLIDDITTVSDVTFCSWLVPNEHNQLRNIKSKYCFGHFELGGFRLNNSLIMPEHEDHIKVSDLNNFEEVYSGHYHKRQNKVNEAGTLITYLGNCFPHDYGDSNEENQRGLMILEWGEKPQYVTWPNSPSFRYYSLSDVLNDTDKLLKPNMSCRINVDIPISFEESTFIKEELVPKFNLRELQLIPMNNSSTIESENTQLTFHSIDQIVSEALSQIDSTSIDKNLLMSIYNSL